MAGRKERAKGRDALGGSAGERISGKRYKVQRIGRPLTGKAMSGVPRLPNDDLRASPLFQLSDPDFGRQAVRKIDEQLCFFSRELGRVSSRMLAASLVKDFGAGASLREQARMEDALVEMPVIVARHVACRLKSGGEAASVALVYYYANDAMFAIDTAMSRAKALRDAYLPRGGWK